MMTILIAHNYNEDSFAVISVSLAHYLADRGHRVVFISHRPLYLKEETIQKDKGEIIICSWPSEERPTTIRDVIWFTRLYFKYKPTIVIGHFVGANITIGMSKLLSFNKVRTFAYYHTLTKQISLDNQNSRKFKRKLLFYRKQIFYEMFCDRIICPSDLAKQDFEENYNSKKGLVIINPMKDRLLNRNNINANKIAISFLGRFAASKGVIELIEAFKSYKSNNKKSNIILNIAGSGNLEVEIKKRIEYESDIFYYGALNYNDIDKYLQKSHFTIIPSKFDAFNMVGVESMMNETPLLISNTTGLAHYLEDGKECFKFDPNIEAMILLFKKVEDNFSRQSEMAIYARTTFLDKFSIEKYCFNFSEEILK